jgi:lipopolysaccharide heptosyltransferase II
MATGAKSNGHSNGHVNGHANGHVSRRALPVVSRHPLSNPTAEPGYEQRPSFDKRLLQSVQRRLKKRTQRLLWSALGFIGYLTRDRSLRRRKPLRAGDHRIKRILVVRVDMLGDLVLTTPAIRALRLAYPDATIDVLAMPGTASVLDGDPDISRILTCDVNAWMAPANWLRGDTWRELGAFLRTTHRPHYDLAISVCGDIGGVVTRLTGARHRVGYAGEAYPHFMTDPVPGKRYLTPQHEVRYVLDLARAAGGKVDEVEQRPTLSVKPDARVTIHHILQEEREKIGARGPIVAIHPGARNGTAKRWPMRHYAELGDRLSRELDAFVVVTGAPNELALSHEIMRRMTAPAFDLTGKTSLQELVALMAESDLVITGDSGPMHIACAVQTPTVALHGPTEPAQSGPTGNLAVILRHQLWCSPCYDSSATAECRFGNPTCMKLISPDDVFAAACQQLERNQRLSATTSNDAPAPALGATTRSFATTYRAPE